MSPENILNWNLIELLAKNVIYVNSKCKHKKKSKIFYSDYLSDALEYNLRLV